MLKGCCYRLFSEYSGIKQARITAINSLIEYVYARDGFSHFFFFGGGGGKISGRCLAVDGMSWQVGVRGTCKVNGNFSNK